MPSDRAIRVEGVNELRRAFNKADKRLGRDLVKTLKESGEPVRSATETLVLAGIPRIGPRWYQMRTGVTRSIVYVAPKQRGRQARQNARLRRPNLADKIGPLMDKALDQNIAEVEQNFLDLLRNVGREWERA